MHAPRMVATRHLPANPSQTGGAVSVSTEGITQKAARIGQHGTISTLACFHTAPRMYTALSGCTNSCNGVPPISMATQLHWYGAESQKLAHVSYRKAGTLRQDLEDPSRRAHPPNRQTHLGGRSAGAHAWGNARAAVFLSAAGTPKLADGFSSRKFAPAPAGFPQTCESDEAAGGADQGAESLPAYGRIGLRRVRPIGVPLSTTSGGERHHPQTRTSMGEADLVDE